MLFISSSNPGVLFHFSQQDVNHLLGIWHVLQDFGDLRQIRLSY